MPPCPVCPKTKLSGRKSWPKGPARTESMVPDMGNPVRSAEQELLANGKAVGTAIAQLRQSLSTQIPEAWLKIHQDRAGNVASSSRLVEVHLVLLDELRTT